MENLSYSFGKKPVFRDVNIELYSKKYALLGDNGCGKTTFLRCLSGYYSNYSGRIKKEDNTSRIKVGYLPQRFGMYPNMTIEENLAYLAVLRDFEDNYKSIIEDAMEKTNLLSLKNKKAKELSGGELQRAGVAQAIMGNPELILLDEPTVSLDIKQRTDFYTMINNLDIKCSLLFSTHLLDDVRNISDEIFVMSKGNVYLTDWSPCSSDLGDKYNCFDF